jgi:cation diffusion facilitator family transporter
MSRRGLSVQGIASLSLAVGVGLVVAKVVVGLATGSLGVLSEAVHSLVDVAASVFALLAVRAAQRPADREHPYGHGRAENLAAFGEGAVLLLAALGIGYEAVNRLLVHPASVDPSAVAIGLMLMSIGIEAGRGVLLTRAGHAAGSDALLASATNRWADVLSSLAVLAGLLGVRAGLAWADPAAALLVTVLIAWAAGRLLWRSGDILMDRAPAGVAETLRAAIEAVDGVRRVSSVRVRRSGSHMLADARISAGPMLPLEVAQGLTSEVRAAVAERLPEVELTLEVEGQSKAEDLVERVHATAARGGQVADLHNVTVEREEDGSLHLTMHARLPPRSDPGAGSRGQRRPGGSPAP